ncbi:MAG: exo-alpha-sialidase [Acidimicrobiales bacterium]
MTSPLPSWFRSRAVDHLALALGTTKGLFFVSDGAVDGPFFPGDRVPAFAQVQDRLLAATNDFAVGPNVRVSDDGGLTWQDAGAHPIAFPSDADTAVTSVWQLHVDRRPKAAGTVWAGVEPAALFRSDDRGETFELVPGIFEHPDRPNWIPSPSGLSLHTVVTHPERPDRVLVAISAGGVYRSDDDGRTWEARNEGIEPAPDEEESAEALPCVHKLAVDATDPDVIWAQTHWGVFRTDNAGDQWRQVGRAGTEGGLPSDFGFSILAHPSLTGTAYVLPLESEMYRCTAQGRCRVYRTTDGGESWEALSEGLPGTNVHVTVLRDAFDIGEDGPHALAFGSSSGHVFGSLDTGETWRLVTSYLPPILCLRVLD